MRCYIPNNKALCLLVSEKKIFKDFAIFFPFGCHGNQTYGWNSISWTTLVQLHPSNIPAKFHQDWPCGLGGEVVLRNCGRRTTDIGRSQKLTMSTSCSGELKKNEIQEQMHHHFKALQLFSKFIQPNWQLFIYVMQQRQKGCLRQTGNFK